MGRFTTNILISEKPHFEDFKCVKALLSVSETEAWNLRYKYRSPMAVSEKHMFYTDQTLKLDFIDTTKVREASLNPKKHLFVLRNLVHSAIRILFEDNMFTYRKGVLIHPKFMKPFTRHGTTYAIFNGINPIVTFQNGYGIIKLRPTSKIFLEVPKIPLESWVITMCDICDKHLQCPNIRHKISKVISISRKKLFLEDIDGLKFACPVDTVRVEASPRTMRGSYLGVLARTALTMKEESTFISQVIDLISSEEGGVILNFDSDLQIEFNLLEG